MSITQYNGNAVVTMIGKDCVAIASDLRFGVQQTTIADNMHKIFMMHDKCFVGLSGLATDMQTLQKKLKMRCKIYSFREEREMKPSVFSSMLSSMLYEHRFGPYFCEPVVCGLEYKEVEPASEGKEAKKELVPFISAMDLIGAQVFTDNFLVSGTTSEELYGICEALYRPNLEKEDLFETISQCLLAAVNRDCLAGWGAIVHIITADGVETRELKSRKD